MERQKDKNATYFSQNSYISTVSWEHVMFKIFKILKAPPTRI